MFQSLDPRAIGLALPFEEALRLAAAHGFAGLELPLDEVLGRAQARSVQQVTEQFQVCGVHPGGWWVPVHVRGVNTSMDFVCTALYKPTQFSAQIASLALTRNLTNKKATLLLLIKRRRQPGAANFKIIDGGLQRVSLSLSLIKALG